ncbi:MAG: hypothetical protein MR373_00925 [Faecalibacterium prausnitzii]|nr:hypothetical protein [Faecalibacterium prausnitzii]
MVTVTLSGQSVPGVSRLNRTTARSSKSVTEDTKVSSRRRLYATVSSPSSRRNCSSINSS